MQQYKHIIIEKEGQKLNYTKPSRGGGLQFQLPPRDRVVHARKLLSELNQASNDAKTKAEQSGHEIHNLCLEVIGEQGYDLKIASLENQKMGIEVRSVRSIDGKVYATIYVPEKKLKNFVKKIERYQTENHARGGRPKNEDLVSVINSIRFPVLRSFWTDDENLFPSSDTEQIWWEVWIKVSSLENPDEAFSSFVEVTANSNLRVSTNVIKFKERSVFLVHGSAQDWMQIFIPLLDRIAEFRKAKDVPTEFLQLSAHDQRAFVENLASRIEPPNANAPSVCILDYGVHADHPLLRPCINNNDIHVYNPNWAIVDNNQPHGTEMAGLALFGDKLPELLINNLPVQLNHRLESVRILHDAKPHPEDTWGYVTIAGVSKAETQAPRRNRVSCLPVTADDQGRDRGFPSSWSGAIDQHSSGQLDEDGYKRLYIISAGNIDVWDVNYNYITSNLSSNIQDPAQSWNALTVGAFTNQIQIRSTDFQGHQPLARIGGLCPASRTSNSWEQTWPIKPDIVLEGGNYVRSPSGRIDGCNDLSLLTTANPAGHLLTCSGDTSAATAQAARLAAILMADYPQLWPETIRGLLVHSAKWTNEMERQIPGENEADRHKRLRCFGYGVPDLDKARHTVKNFVSLIHQGTIQPYKLDGSADKTNHYVLHSLPWPKEALRLISNQDATVKITLSYFIEPSPGRRGWGKKFRYASHGLRFALKGPTDTDEQFKQRISSQEWDEENDRPSTSDPITTWAIGSRLRTRGSIHCDWCTLPAADIAQCEQVAVYPVTGWWRERKHLGFVERQCRYSLIVTISTPNTEVDLYTPITQKITPITEIEI
ncbi:MAG: hypothetical protein A2Y12_08265 [Planctomycetes bacterium GWF2_42_9]|nr:MAG: hypothetical protein A2Y12_08265 [Planctomycetes bacterium GWF2_42_9]HAL44435.1 hypothetical protein [Phycisphaerales bacterium]